MSKPITLNFERNDDGAYVALWTDVVPCFATLTKVNSKKWAIVVSVDGDLVGDTAFAKSLTLAKAEAERFANTVDPWPFHVDTEVPAEPEAPKAAKVPSRVTILREALAEITESRFADDFEGICQIADAALASTEPKGRTLRAKEPSRSERREACIAAGCVVPLDIAFRPSGGAFAVNLALANGPVTFGELEKAVQAAKPGFKGTDRVLQERRRGLYGSIDCGWFLRVTEHDGATGAEATYQLVPLSDAIALTEAHGRADENLKTVVRPSRTVPFVALATEG
jgi:hypothetical protein